MNELQYTCITDPAKGIVECEGLLKTPLSVDMKAEVITALGCISDERYQRRAYNILVRHITHEALVIPVIQALGKIKDARATFGLMDCFSRATFPQLKRYILGYFAETHDPRATGFLRRILPTLRENLEEIAQYALRACEGNVLFEYGFCGADALYQHALELRCQPIKVTRKDLSVHEREITGNRTGAMTLPQTYVIDTSCTMYVGGQQNEHVVVANGKRVIAAGEIAFEKKGEDWRVKRINNRSYGYYPDPSCFFWVEDYFKSSDVGCDKRNFDEMYPQNGFDDPELLELFRFHK